MEKKVLIIADEQITSYASILKLIEEHDCEVVNIYNKDWDVDKLKAKIKEIQTPSNVIKILDTEYVPRSNTSKRKGSKSMMSLVAMASLFGGLPDIGPKSPTLPSGISIIPEYKLIKEKKSKLSRRQRDYVEHLFNQQFMTLEEFKEKNK